MLAMACAGDAGHLDQSRYHRALFDAYFKDRAVPWPEMIRWQAIGARLGRWPIRWSPADKMTDAEADRQGADATAAKRRSTYFGLMLYISSRASAIEKQGSPHLNNMPWKVLLVDKQDREFFDLAIAENPSALPPLFPADVSFMQPIVPGFEPEP